MIFKTRITAFFALLFFCSVRGVSQDIVSPYQWQVTSQKTGEGTYELTFTSNDVSGWQLYAPDQVLADVKMAELTFSDSSFSQIEKFSATGNSKNIKSSVFDNQEIKVFEGKVQWKTAIRISGIVPAQLQGVLNYSYGKNDEFYPSNSYPFVVDLEGGVISTTRILIPSIDVEHPVNDCGDSIKKDSSLFIIFLLGLLGGFIALLTPCVFPMIPLTVSFFTKKAHEKKKGIRGAVLYGFFIFLIYVLITLPFHLAGKTNPEIFNNISTNIWLNIFFFVIFVLFALSFFGYYEIALPSGLANKMGTRSGIGNITGIFFMALTLAIVSFSCTGPILGTLLAGVAKQGAWPLTIGAAGFGLALGLPFAIFALFPNWLHSMPKSGGWLTDIKVVLGFIELALAVKFLANADNVKQWGILKREVFIGLWIIIGVLIVLYLLGWLRFSHSSPVKRFSKIRIAFLFLFAAATLYLIPGVTNTSWSKLSLISGFPPPLCYSIYKNPVNCDKSLLDYEQAIQLAKKENKPVLIDFTGWACVNCRRMEEKVWTKPYIEKMMRNDFILVSLYVDERTKLPVSQQMLYKAKNGSEKSIVTIGDKWTAFQIDNFNATSQPQYAIISPDEKILVKTKFYTPDASEFASWLQCGLDAFKKISKQ
ncbi:MAG: thioredoxin family protein [Bacteroidetes bacterium]|nr:thioredoxin family protein [Bacteroidota bacterium]MBS1633893.1 thioredoxin family protein [Bacteroidota bacterium]